MPANTRSFDTSPSPHSASTRAHTAELRFCVESHARAATLYVIGPLTVAGALRALRLCDRLPAAVSELRIDMRAATLPDATPVQAVAMHLVRWRRARPGRHSRIELPPVAQRPVVAPLPPRRNRSARRTPSAIPPL